MAPWMFSRSREANGYVAIEAEHFAQYLPGSDGSEWRVVRRVAQRGDVMKAFPDTAPGVDSNFASGATAVPGARHLVNTGASPIVHRSPSPVRSLMMLLAPLPALAVGVLVMQRHGVSPLIWGQQLAAGLTLTLLCAALSVAPRPAARFRPRAWAIVGSVALLLLTATLLHSGVDGVRRWVSLGPLQLHAAFVALPILIIVSGRMLKGDVLRTASWIVPCTAVAVAGVLVLQPDASQAFAFAVAVGLVLLQRRRARWIDWAAVAVVSGSALLALSRPDSLEAVPHVEGIAGLAASGGEAWLIAAVLALVLLPIPFIAEAARRRDRRPESLALAGYFGIVCIAPFAGPFPVPLMGYGLSPILGYFAALAWVVAGTRSTDAEAGSLAVPRSQAA